MKHLILFEVYINNKPILLHNFYNLPDLHLHTNAPQVGSKNILFDIIDDRIISDNIKPYCLYDYVITNECEFLIGLQHYKMSKKSKVIKTSGELKIDDNGKIIYLNNESGHYIPTKELLKKVVLLFDEINLLSPNVVIDYLY